MKVFVTRREIMGKLGITPSMFRKMRSGGVIRPVQMRGYVRAVYYRADEVAEALGAVRGWQG